MDTSPSSSPASTRVLTDLTEVIAAVGNRQTACCIGVFDGVHVGHQRLIGSAVTEAHDRGLLSVVLTFSSHPLTLLAPAYAPLMLTDPEEKVRRLAKLRPSLIVSLPFTQRLADMEPYMFMREILTVQLRALSLWCGTDFRFGRDGGGDVKLLKEVGEGLGLGVHAIEPVSIRHHPISSTWIRSLIEEGKMELATDCLGRRYTLTARVVPGQGRGRKLGFPTANLEWPAGIVFPGDGIYAVRVEVGNQLYDGMMQIGPSPTFGITQRRFEVHLFDFQGELVGETIRVHFVAFMRDVLRFESAEKLADQMKTDQRHALSILRLQTEGR